MNEILFEILQLVIIVLSGIVTRYLIPWLKLKIETEKGVQITDFIKSAVSGAEQIMSGQGLGPEKKNYVINMTKKFLSDKKFNMTDEQINILIESAVQAVKNAKKEAK